MKTNTNNIKEWNNKRNGQIDFFNLFNLTPTTNLVYIKWGFVNKLSFEMKEALTLETIEELDSSVEAYLTLSNPKEASKYIKKLLLRHGAVIAKSQVMYDKKLNVGSYAYITNDYIKSLIEEYSKIRYHINYNIDLLPTDKQVYNQLLKDINATLMLKYQNYCSINGSDNLLTKSFQRLSKKIDDIITIEISKSEKELNQTPKKRRKIYE